MTIRAGWRVGSAGMLALLLSGSVLVSGSALAQEDTASSEDQKQTATEADEVSDKATGVSDEDASFGQGGAQTPLDQRRNAVTFGQMDVDQDGVLSEEEARQADQLELFQRLDDGEGEVTRETFQDEVGSDTLPEVAE
ncbi:MULTISPECIES: hypothetical protein [Chromohalobacter]|uniref:EF hand n=1 Tax=Chromohalobacter beijerinckii TaxID=86179 RepID=A0ABV8XJP5_9GAMM|nr:MULTISPECIES: hypothetical protein [Chromohalobacter]MCK0751327.1 hypothetical protein [Chromohalobacter japonicus]MCK0764367.1 hypothetical protein [Chromohalobacter beijerinckii]